MHPKQTLRLKERRAGQLKESASHRLVRLKENVISIAVVAELHYSLRLYPTDGLVLFFLSLP